MELMEFLYRVMEELAKADVPIVFKGAMVLKLVIQRNNPSTVERKTKDIDGDWVGDSPTMEQIEKALRQAVKQGDNSLDIQVVREYGEKRSAGFKIVDENQKKVARIDLSVRKNAYAVPYVSYINEVTITGASLTKMLSDKLHAISDEHIYRRIKDLLDIYVISFVSEFKIEDIYSIWERTQRIPGEFSHFRSGKKEIGRAYDKIEKITNKPEFEELYARLSKFLEPFYEKEQHLDLIWRDGEWDNMDLAYNRTNHMRR